MITTIFDEQYPGLGAEIGANAPTSNGNSTNENPKWWEQLIQQVPDILGVIIPNPNATVNTQLPTQPASQNSIFTAKNMIVAGLVVIAILIAYKYISKI